MLQCHMLKYPVHKGISMPKKNILRQTPEEANQSFITEALASWAHFQETGLHVTLDEVLDWLSTWGTSSEKEAPVCHK